MADKNNIPQFVNSDSFMADKNYVKWLSDLKKRFHIAQLKAAVKVKYYDPRVSLCLCVDPSMEKYPDVSSLYFPKL